MTIFYFTGTGNSLYVARKLSDNIISIPQAMKNGMKEYSDDVIGFVYPVYGHAAPEIVKEFIEKIDINAKYIFAIATCSHRCSTAESIGKIEFDYSASIEMVGNHIPMVDIKQEILIDKHVDEQIQKVKNEIESGKLYWEKEKFGDKVIKQVLKMIHKKPACGKFYVTDNCIKCKVCEKVCPRGNISINVSGLEFGDKCEGCLACVHNCPQKAIRVKREKNDGRYRNENVALKDIINSNNIIR